MEEIQSKLKYCKYCGEKVPEDSVVCTHCGRQIENLKSESPQVIIQNSNTNTNVNQNTNGRKGKEKNKWVAFVLCLFFGIVGVHKFYEEKIGMGILYLFTGGLFGIGWFIDIIVLLCQPNPYYV